MVKTNFEGLFATAKPSVKVVHLDSGYTVMHLECHGKRHPRPTVIDLPKWYERLDTELVKAVHGSIKESGEDGKFLAQVAYAIPWLVPPTMVGDLVATLSVSLGICYTPPLDGALVDVDMMLDIHGQIGKNGNENSIRFGESFLDSDGKWALPDADCATDKS